MTDKMTPGIPSSLDDAIENGLKKEMYVLYYIGGGSPHTQCKFFESELQNFQSIIQRCKDHCLAMGIRFVRVQPFLSDLVGDENKRNAVGY